MKTFVSEALVTALTSISHNGGERNGIITQMRREKMMQPSGKMEEVPIVSGNSIRGILRDRGMLYMLSQLGYGVNYETNQVKGLPLNAFYFLFSGGSLTSTGEAGVNVDKFRKLKHLLPLISIFGGASGNAIMPGKLKVGKLIPICKQTAHLLPEWCLPETLVSAWDLTQTEMYTRRDDAKNDRLRPMLAGAETMPALEDVAETDVADIAETEVAELTRKKAPQQMMYEQETLCAGTRFFWEITLEDASPLEVEAFMSCVLTFSKSPYLGGKSAVGHGKVSIKFNNWIEIDPRMVLKGTEVAMKPGALYQEFLEKSAGDIRELLEAMK